jgi:hypothetical protein
MPALGLALALSSVARADKFPAVPPQPKLFASVYGSYALKILPDVSSVSTRTRTEGVHSADQAGQIVGNSEGVFFALDENAKEKVIWRAKLVNIPSRAIIVESGKYVITLDSWRSAGFDHCLVVYGEKGKVIADFKLKDLLTAKEIESLPASVTHRGWSDKDIAEFEDRSREQDELVIRMKYKGWTKVIRLSLSSGRIVEKTDARYAIVLREVHARLEAPHVIRTAHIKDAITSLAKEGQAITPYLLKLLREGSKEGAAKEHGGGWPLWALVCGTLFEVGGEEGRAALSKILADPTTAKTVQVGADRAAEALGKNIKGQD